jgi:hypothetical protein
MCPSLEKNYRFNFNCFTFFFIALNLITLIFLITRQLILTNHFWYFNSLKFYLTENLKCQNFFTKKIHNDKKRCEQLETTTTTEFAMTLLSFNIIFFSLTSCYNDLRYDSNNRESEKDKREEKENDNVHTFVRCSCIMLKSCKMNIRA